jgi:DNA repair protein RadD
MLEPRPYQLETIDKTVSFIKSYKKDAGLVVAPTGSGKSVIIANTIKEFGQPTLILQPTKEILEQNYAKYTSYGFEASIYSASAGKKQFGDVMFATIGSIGSKADSLKDKRLLLIDECDLVNPKGGMYERFIKEMNIPLVGFTATPYRLSTDGFGGSMLKFLTRTRPKIFSKLVYHIQCRELFDAGYLAKLHYWDIPGLDSSRIKVNSTGAEYDDESLREYYKQINFPDSIAYIVKRLVDEGRKHILVFTRFIEEAQYLADKIPGAAVITSENTKKEREQLLADFKSGKIKIMVNVGILTTGFDFPELDTVVIARPTMSLRLWYQMIGRVVRPHFSKLYGAVIDMGDNLRLFGKVEDLTIENAGKDKWFISSNGKQLTNIYYER